MNLSTPQGFRDILCDEACMREKIQHEVQTAFAQMGYKPIETPTLEYLDVMQQGGFCNVATGTLTGATSKASAGAPASAPFKFFDATGNLVAMRPDVTVQVARMCATRFKGSNEQRRFRYAHRVFRETDGSLQAQARELTQIGAECIGASGVEADAEVVGLMARALKIAGVKDYTLALATVSPMRALLQKSNAPAWWQDLVFASLHASDLVQLDCLTCEQEVSQVAREAGISEDELSNFAFPAKHAQAVRKLARVRGGVDAIDEARSITSPLGCSDGLDELALLHEKLTQQGIGDRVLIDFSMINSFDYYTGLVFSAFSPYVGTSLGGGGRYDGLIGTFGEDKPAAGCALFLELAISAADAEVGAEAEETPRARETKIHESRPSKIHESRPLRIAVPKGSLNADTIRVLSEAGLDTTGLENPGRQLIIKNPGVNFIIVRPTDAPAFVAHGAADCGICGRDSILEAAADVVQLVDLHYGECRFIVAEPAGGELATRDHYKREGSIRVATKYPRITKAHYEKTGMQAEIVKLHGNIELAPLTGMAERIVDITATGTTLRENNLVIVEEVISSTARFFANVSAYRTDARCVKLAQKLAKGTS